MIARWNSGMISPDLFEFLESGVSILVGSRSDRLLPECCRGLGARVEEEGRGITVFLPVATTEQTVSNLRDNGRIAVCFSRAGDHRSMQIKGQVISIQEANEADRAVIQRYRHSLAESWGVIGVPSRITLRMAHWPCHSVRLRVDSVFNQTPGPGAGAAMGAANR